MFWNEHRLYVMLKFLRMHVCRSSGLNLTDRVGKKWEMDWHVVGFGLNIIFDSNKNRNLIRCCCRNTNGQAASTPSKPWRRETSSRGMKWKGKRTRRSVTSTSSPSYATKLIRLIITPRTVITVSYAPPSAPLCLSPVWCVRSGSLRPSTAPTTPSWSTCLHVSRRQNMCVLSWSTPQEETSWCTYMPTSFLSHVLCEFCCVCVRVCVC